MQKASGAADAAQLAALAGQGAGTADFEAARALTGPGALNSLCRRISKKLLIQQDKN